jgi:hypothetical protein
MKFYRKINEVQIERCMLLPLPSQLWEIKNIKIEARKRLNKIGIKNYLFHVQSITIKRVKNVCILKYLYFF